MIDEARAILNYLPISRSKIENDYIDYLWGAMCAIDEGEKDVQGFALLPFHLLFLLVIQCKILRIAQECVERYTLSITLKNPKNGEEGILTPKSPFTLAFFGESELADLCKVIGLEKEGVNRIKKLVRYRNSNLAHASGYTELYPEKKVVEYISAIEELQEKMTPLNEAIARRWLTEFAPEDRQNLKEFVEVRLPDTYLSIADFECGLLKVHFSN